MIPETLSNVAVTSHNIKKMVAQEIPNLWKTAQKQRQLINKKDRTTKSSYNRYPLKPELVGFLQGTNKKSYCQLQKLISKLFFTENKQTYLKILKYLKSFSLRYLHDIGLAFIFYLFSSSLHWAKQNLLFPHKGHL